MAAIPNILSPARPLEHSRPDPQDQSEACGAELTKLNLCMLAGTLGQGGAERQLFYILQSLRQCGARPRLFCLTQNEYWEPKIIALGVPVIGVGHSQSRLKRLLQFVRALRAAPPEILQSQHFYTNAYVAAAARWLGCREIGAIRNLVITEKLDSGTMGGWLNLHSPRLIAANSRMGIARAIADGLPAERLFFLPNVVDTEQMRPAPGLRGKPVRLLAAGRLVKQKRFDRLLRVLSLAMQRKALDLQVSIVGAGPLQPELERQAAAAGLLPRCLRFQAPVADMQPLYHQADILALTSDHEGTPNVVLEAMACGLPVVATAVGEVPALLRHGETGFVFSPDNEAGMAQALADLCAQPTLRTETGRRAREFVERHHALSRLPGVLCELYHRARAQRRDAARLQRRSR